uniref:Uncharacterized protein n=1 Tax=uncultured bacterium contig00002 TaxID=1181494 RepID=A0A806KN37_9BACT|nr:hypothetical protein [uncultured bacterium contig00002]
MEEKVENREFLDEEIKRLLAEGANELPLTPSISISEKLMAKNRRKNDDLGISFNEMYKRSDGNCILFRYATLLLKPDMVNFE